MKIISEFQKFALRGNMFELAVGFTVGAAFTSVAKSLVNDIIMPPIGLLLGKADFQDLYIILRSAQESIPEGATLEQARELGAVTLNYGVFINNIFAFLLVTIVMFGFIRMMNKLDEELDERLDDDDEKPEEPADKKCEFCRSVIPHQATRCPFCTSQLDIDSAT